MKASEGIFCRSVSCLQRNSQKSLCMIPNVQEGIIILEGQPVSTVSMDEAEGKVKELKYGNVVGKEKVA